MNKPDIIINKEVNEKYDAICMFFSLLSTFKELKLTKTEIRLLALIAMNDGIMGDTCKVKFVSTLKSSLNILYNAISSLKKKKILYKKDKTIYLHKQLKISTENISNYKFEFKCLLKNQ